MKKRGSFNSRAQIWVETVVYTLIGISLIGFVLSVALPKIEELKDKTLLESSKKILEELDSKIVEVSSTPGNQRTLYADIKRGKMVLDGEKNEIFFTTKSSYKYSEEGYELSDGKVFFKTEKISEGYKVNFKINYSSFNITINSKKILENLDASPKPYKIIILNRGNSNININIEK